MPFGEGYLSPYDGDGTERRVSCQEHGRPLSFASAIEGANPGSHTLQWLAQAMGLTRARVLQIALATRAELLFNSPQSLLEGRPSHATTHAKLSDLCQAARKRAFSYELLASVHPQAANTNNADVLSRCLREMMEAMPQVHRRRADEIPIPLGIIVAPPHPAAEPTRQLRSRSAREGEACCQSRARTPLATYAALCATRMREWQ